MIGLPREIENGYPMLTQESCEYIEKLRKEINGRPHLRDEEIYLLKAAKKLLEFAGYEVKERAEG